MEENLPVPIKNEITFSENGQFYTQRRRRKRKKTGRAHKRLKKLLLFLVFAALIYGAVKNHNTIYSYITTLFPSSQPNTSASNNSDSSKKETDNTLNDAPTNNNEPSYNFIDTSPTEFQFINESKYNFNFEEESVNLPGVSEIYNAYSQNAPVVLIVHSSPLESYSNENGYSTSSSFYSENENVAKIGKYISDKLSENGINALHIDSYGEFSSLYEGKEAFKQMVTDTLNENPSISYIIDVSRGMSINSDLSMNNETIYTDGVKYPTIQLWGGTNELKSTTEQKQGIYFAQKLAEHINNNTPLLISSLTASKYDLSLGFPCTSIRADIGSYACSFEEALLSADLFASYLVEFLSK